MPAAARRIAHGGDSRPSPRSAPSCCGAPARMPALNLHLRGNQPGGSERSPRQLDAFCVLPRLSATSLSQPCSTIRVCAFPRQAPRRRGESRRLMKTACCARDFHFLKDHALSACNRPDCALTRRDGRSLHTLSSMVTTALVGTLTAIAIYSASSTAPIERGGFVSSGRSPCLRRSIPARRIQPSLRRCAIAGRAYLKLARPRVLAP